MLRWIYGHTRRDQVWKDEIRDRLGIAPIEEKVCPTPVDMVCTCPTETSRGTGA